MSEDEKKAIFIIKKYLKVLDNPKWTDEYTLANYSIAVKQLIENANTLKSLKRAPGITQITQGARSTTFENGNGAWIITEDVKMLLPNLNNFKAW